MTRHEPWRLLAIDLGAGGPWRATPWTPREPAFERMASWRGGGLGLALLGESASSPPSSPPLVLAVGECVARGVPTAARVSVASRSPLSGFLSEGLVGSDFGRRLASVADAVRIDGRAPADSVLVIEADGSARIARAPATRGLSSAATHAALEAELGPCATLSIGPGGERGAKIASLAACSSKSAGGGPPHFVGRGGLGAVLGRTGLKALVVRAPAVPSVRDSELTRALRSSPRLEARARGGTLELAHSLAARGDLGDGARDAGSARAFAEGAELARLHQHGCAGCPTPCGWVFRRADGPGQAARFGASHALGLQLGFSDFDAALGLLARCDELGLDAKEVGAGLALLAELDPGLRGCPELFARVLDEAALGEGRAAALVDGVHALGLALGVASTTVRRSSVRPDKNLASLLGQCVSARGTDPMRAFPFLAAESAGLASLRELCRPLELPPGSEDPFQATAKGRLVGWHEDLVLALDLTGFCAFSACALLSDRLASLDALAAWIAPRALAAEETFGRAPGRALLAAGAEIARAQRELNARWGWTPADDVPAWAAARLSSPGMEPEYRAYRRDPTSFEREATAPAPIVATKAG
ncbi:MAG TPA: aldehyde ferredoxin oxidoreductase N-terminal domain-containing protein, partial [Planctomycetota bacterium]|nr:aldehyde ferredoxin oxidoreductase N-terminal domain-containing protein [Planctomycetota bacterium]